LKWLAQPADALENAARCVLRRGKDLEDLNFASLEDYAVRECPACVNTDAHKKSQLEPQKLAKESSFYRIQESEVSGPSSVVRGLLSSDTSRILKNRGEGNPVF
jgi:hypothetical protein